MSQAAKPDPRQTDIFDFLARPLGAPEAAPPKAAHDIPPGAPPALRRALEAPPDAFDLAWLAWQVAELLGEALHECGPSHEHLDPAPRFARLVTTCRFVARRAGDVLRETGARTMDEDGRGADLWSGAPRTAADLMAEAWRLLQARQSFGGLTIAESNFLEVLEDKL